MTILKFILRYSVEGMIINDVYEFSHEFHPSAHRNDLESILPYLIVAFMYVLADPPSLVACILFGVVCGCRLLHTVVYAVYVLPQPARTLSFFVPFFITCYMAGYTACVFFLVH